MWLSRYPRPIEIRYDQGSEFIGHEFIKSLIEELYRITAQPSTSVNPMYNAVLERIHQVLRNLVNTFNISQTNIDKNDPWMEILAAAEFAIFPTTNRKNVYSPVQLVLVNDMIFLIKHNVDQKLIRQRKQAQINKDNICENRHRVDHQYKVGDKVILTKHTVYKYETPYTGPFVIAQFFTTNGTVNLQCGPTKIRYNMSD